MAKARPEKIDLYRQERDQYQAGKQPALVDIRPAWYLAVAGRGAPGGDDFGEAIAALYGMAYTVKMTRKFAGKGDYVVCKLECRYESDACLSRPAEEWTWTLLIRTPDVVGEDDLDDARRKLAAKGKGDGAERIVLLELAEGPCVQMLHVGPYDQEPVTVARMLDFAEAQGLRRTGEHHEVYLSDPRRVAPEKLRTILRHPVE